MYLVTCSTIFTLLLYINLFLFCKASIGIEMFSYNLHAGFINSVLGFWAGEGEGLMKLTSVVRVSSPPPSPPLPT